jgi:integrase
MADSLEQPAIRLDGKKANNAAGRLAAGLWLNDVQVRQTAKTLGKHRVGPRTWLVCDRPDRPGRGSWEFRYMIAGKARSMGLGPYPTVGVGEARQKAEAAEKQLANGTDPLSERQVHKAAAAAEAAKAISFREFAERHVNSHETGWRNPKHRQQWRNTLATYAYPVIGDLPLAAITTEHVLQVLRPIWNDKPETASRLRGRIETVLDAAKVSRLREGDNPAVWRGHLAFMLPKKSKVRAVKHHAALDWRDIPAFMAQLWRQNGTGSLALRFAILTAARSGEVRGAQWNEIDLNAAVWTVPASRMKAAKEHRVPLSADALAILGLMQERQDGSGLIFPGMKRGMPLSDMSLGAALRRMGRGDLTTHGFRSTFRDWAGETGKPDDIAEAALAHTVRDKTQAAYQRGDLLDRRRKLMDAWCEYCSDNLGNDSADEA